MGTPSTPFHLALHLPRLFYCSVTAVVLAVALCKVSVRYSFNNNEGWNAFWAAAWGGSDLYPDPSKFKLNNYPPLWSYATGALGRLIGDNVQAGRILASLALLLNAVAVSLIVRAITGRGQGSWFAGAALLAIFGVFYETYVAVNDPQIAANCLMSFAILLSLPQLERTWSKNAEYFSVPLMLIAGLLKPNVVAAPASIAVFLMLYRRSRLAHFLGLSAMGFVTTCIVLYASFGPSLFSSVLFPRPYEISAAWIITKGQIVNYNVLLSIPLFLSFSANPNTKLVCIYSMISFILGFLFAGGADVDINVFFDFAVSISIGLGLLQTSINDLVREKAEIIRNGVVSTGWLAVALLSLTFSLQSGFREASYAFDAVADNTQRDDVAYVRSHGDHVLCDDLALCYWAGKRFEVDLNNLQTLIWAEPALESHFEERIADCSYSLIQLGYDWDNARVGPFTANVVEALKTHYREARRTDSAVYWVPSYCK